MAGGGRTLLISLVIAYGLSAAGAPPAPSELRRRPTIKDDLLVVPRLVLTLPRLILRGLSYPVKWAFAFEERHRVWRRLYALSTFADGRIGLRPSIRWTFGFVPAGGISFFDERLFGDETDFRLTVEGGYPSVLFVEVRARPTSLRAPIWLDLGATYDRRGDRVFAGVGPASAGEVEPNGLPRSRYAIDAFDLRADAILPVWRYVQILGGVRLGVRRFRNGDSGGDPPIEEVYCVRTPQGACIPGTVNEALVPAFNRGTQFVRSSLALRIDTRDHLFRPSSGFFAEALADYSHGLGGDRSRYVRLLGELGGAVNLWRRTHVLYARLQLQGVASIVSTPVPFSELNILGGPDSLRGFLWGQFRGESAALFTAEYRWLAWMWADATLFVDYGGTFGSAFEGFSFGRMVVDVGMGLRVRTSRRFFMRIQGAYGIGEGFQLSFSAHPGP